MIPLLKEKKKIALRYPFIKKYFKGKLDKKMYLEGLESFKHQLIKEGLTKEDIMQLRDAKFRIIAKGYKLLEEYGVIDHIYFIVEMVDDFYDIKPEFIILLDTAAVPLGFAIKEAWRAAYREKTPYFLRLDPRYLVWSKDKEREMKFLKEITKVIKNKNSVILIFDETSRHYRGLKTYKEIFVDKGDFFIDPKDPRVKYSNTGNVGQILWSNGFRNIWIYAGCPSTFPRETMTKITKRTGVDSRKVEFAKRFSTKLLKIRAQIKKLEERKIAKAYIHDLKKIGKKAGKIIKEERKT